MTKRIFLILVLFITCFSINTSAQKQGKAAVDSMLITLKKSKPDINRVKLLDSLALITSGFSSDSAIKYARQGLALAQKLNYKQGVTNSARLMGAIQMDLGKNDLALANFKLSYEIAEQLNDTYGMIAGLNNIGAIYQRTSNYPMAANYFFKGLKIAEGYKDDKAIAQSETNIGTLYAQQQNIDQGIKHARRAEELYQHLNQPSERAKNLEIYGLCYVFAAKFKQAIPLFLKALKLYESQNDELGKAIIYTQLVNCSADDPVKQVEYLNKAQVLWEKFAPENLNAIANTANYGATYYAILTSPNAYKIVHEKLGMTKEQLLAGAETYLKKGIAQSRKAGNNDLLLQVIKYYADLSEYKKDYKEALTSLKSYTTLHDSLYSQDNKNKIAALEGEREIAIRDKQIANRKLEVKQLWIYGILFIVLLTGILLSLLNRYRIKQLRLNHTLQQQEAQQEAKELSYRNKLSESELKAIRSQMNPHFIFNVLNSIESYVLENDSKTASRLVQKFATLSRLILENSTQSMVIAEREWKALKLYTELEAMRFNNQFSYAFYVDPELDLATLMLPPMLVQPLIENSIHHGLRNSAEEKSSLNVRLEQTDTEIYFTVDDTGIGMEESEKFKTYSSIKSKSIGLNAIRERIEIINEMGKTHKAGFEIRKKTEEEGLGTIAILTLPKVIRNTFIP
ncbi:two-component sensor histidine kinase [Mucilaginibacter sp. UYP25]|uniref:tetratricopeptide repeat-containing sensor histidine kinase n=1 Tax=unclassified Mucilaginibacter TaxID=2617802 RepID=UPI003398C419